jgi:hypothetical protein
VRADLVSENALYCRRKAAACWRAAKRTRDPKRKREFQELAQAWLRLADRAEHVPEWQVQAISDKKTETE